tara:strand:- start:536 stop:958 length:423 start_codon:yes stop_codon:yes gene_type:complete
MSINDYKILGLEITDDNEKVKKQYKKLALKYHPDKNNSKEAAEKFTKISQAYQNIINKKPKTNTFTRENVFNVNINSDDIFNQLFKNMRMSEMSNVFVSPLPTQTTFTSKTVQIVNGKRIEKVREKKNGVTRTQTIITDI